MSQVQFENTEKLAIKKVHFTGTDTLRAGYVLCYDADYGTDSEADASRAYKAEKPSAANVDNFAGVVSEKYDGKVGPCAVEIYVPEERGQKVPIWTDASVVVNVTDLYLQIGSYAAGAAGAKLIGKAMQTVDRSVTNGTCFGRLGCLVRDTGGATPGARGRTAAELPTAAIWNKIPLDELRRNPRLGSLLEADFNRPVDFPNEIFKDTTATILVAGAGEGIGELRILSSADNEEGAVAWDCPIVASGGQPWGFECRIKVENITDARATVFAGLMDADMALAGDHVVDNGADLLAGSAVGIARLQGDGDEFLSGYSDAASAFIVHEADWHVPVANTYFTFGMYFDGTTVTLYKNGAVSGDAIAATDIADGDYPAGLLVKPIIAVKGDNAADFTATVDWIKVAQLA